MQMNSSIGKTTASRSQNFKTYEVDDESESFLEDPTISHHNHDEDEIEKMRQENEMLKRQQKMRQEKMTDNSKVRLNTLLGIFIQKKEVSVCGINFEFRTISSKDMSEVVNSIHLHKYDLEVKREYRRQILSRVILKIDGVDINMIIDQKDTQAKLALIDNMEEYVVQALFIEYGKFSDEVDLKMGLKSPELVKELVEDLKKA